MAVYVILKFDEDEQAKKFTEVVIKHKGAIETCDTFRGGGDTVYDATIRAVYKAPTLICRCDHGQKGIGWTRGRKYGWYVCSKCGKPGANWANGTAWFTALGTNLLPPSISKDYRPPNWDSTVQWDFLLTEEQKANAPEIEASMPWPSAADWDARENERRNVGNLLSGYTQTAREAR